MGLTLTQVLGAGCPEEVTQSWCQGENCHSPIWEAGSRSWPCIWAHLAWKVAQTMSQSVISQPRAPRPQSLREVGKLEEGESAVGRCLYNSSTSCPNYSVIIRGPDFLPPPGLWLWPPSPATRSLCSTLTGHTCPLGPHQTLSLMQAHGNPGRVTQSF